MMNRRVYAQLVLTFLFCLAALCPPQFSLGSEHRRPDSPDKDPQYFPLGTFGAIPGFRDITARWYAKHLRAMSEPSLFAQSADKELHVYRFLWLRTFDRPVVVRLSIRQDGGGSITTKITNGTGGNRPGKIITDKTIEIGKAEIQRALELANAAGFWSMKTEEGSLGKDGAEWIVEGIRLGQYHIAERWSPNTGGYRELCLYLLKLGEVEEKEVY